MDHCSKSWRHCREEYPRGRKSLQLSFSQGQPAKDFDQFNPNLLPSLNLGKKEYQRPKDYKACDYKASDPYLNHRVETVGPYRC